MFPMEAAAREQAGSHAANMKALDSRLEGLMAVVRLSYLVQREGGWGATASWGDVLSLGEPAAQRCSLLQGGTMGCRDAQRCGLLKGSLLAH